MVGRRRRCTREAVQEWFKASQGSVGRVSTHRRRVERNKDGQTGMRRCQEVARDEVVKLCISPLGSVRCVKRLEA